MMNRMPVRMKEQTGQTLRRLHVKITAFLLVFAMACTAMASLPMEVFAADNVVGGTFGDNLTWKLNKSTGVLTISGNGPMPATNYGAAWYSNRSYIRTVVIEDGITSVGQNNFHSYYSLQNVMISNSVRSIGNAAFYKCENLKSVQITDKDTLIPSNECILQANCFGLCSNLVLFDFPSQTTIINGRSFEGCSKLTEIDIPETVYSIGGLAFFGCPLEHIVISSSVISIGEEAFVGSKYFIVAPDNQFFSSDDGVLFNKDKTQLICFPHNNVNYYNIPDSVTSVNDGAFIGCSNLLDVPNSKNVTTISTWTYQSCGGLKNIMIPYSIKTIGMFAFIGCGNLESVAIPNSVKKIDGWAFEDCDNLKKIYADKGTAGYDFAIANNIDVEPFNAANSVTNYEVVELDKSTLQLYVNRSVTLNAAINNKTWILGKT